MTETVHQCVACQERYDSQVEVLVCEFHHTKTAVKNLSHRLPLLQ